MQSIHMRLLGALTAIMLISGGTAVQADDTAEAEVVCDVKKGERVFRKCMTCHVLEPGKKKTGPSLWGIFGRVSGTEEGFNYSKAMKEAEITWTEETISAYIENPRKYIPRNKMAFPGVRKEQERVDLMCFLKENTMDPDAPAPDGDGADDAPAEG